MISAETRKCLSESIVWDNHACMPLRPDDDSFLPQLERFRASGVNVVVLNVVFDVFPWQMGMKMLAAFRHWISQHSNEYVVIESVGDIERAKKDGRLAICFDIEGGRAVEEHPGFVELFYRLGVRWMLIAYNKNNRLGGGCQDQDTGLTDYGRQIIREMERVGMVLCCSHTGHRTAREAIAFSKSPVIFSHSNPAGVFAHDRNIPDDLIQACAATGGVININGIGMFLGNNDNRTETMLRHIDYTVSLVGAEHVGIALDYVFDPSEFETFLNERPDLFPVDSGYAAGFKMIEPERFLEIAEGLLKRGYREEAVKGILGENNLRVARDVWKPVSQETSKSPFAPRK